MAALTVLLSTSLLALAADAAPDPISPREDQTEWPQPRWGGFGYATIGVAFGEYGRTDRSLAVGGPVEWSRASLIAGGGGRVLIAGRLLLGGKGFALLLPQVHTDAARVWALGGGGGFELGFVVLNRRGWLVYPTIGGGGLGWSLEVLNRGDAPIQVGGRTVGGGGRLDASAGHPYLDVGVGAVRRWWRGGGGPIHGLHVGLMVATSDGRWETEGQALTGLAPVSLALGYLRVEFGGGGFLTRKPE